MVRFTVAYARGLFVLRFTKGVTSSQKFCADGLLAQDHWNRDTHMHRVKAEEESF